MTTEAHVARLRLVAAEEAHVRRGAILLEDAMRIATLAPDADRRSYIVRHLDVGVIDPDGPPHTLALQIERRLAHVQATAVLATDPAAATARAVYFPDEVTAIAALARELATRGTPSAWFWPHVADGAAKLATPIEALRACLKTALARLEGPLAIAAVVEAAAPVDAPIAHDLLASLAPGDGIALVRATFGAAAAAELAGLPSAHPDILATISPRWRARLEHWATRWGPDARSLWLAAIAAVGSRGAITGARSELARARQLIGAILGRARPRALPAQSALAAEQHATTGITEAEARTPPAIEESFVETLAAGALFLIRPLATLGIAAWLDEHAWTSGVNWPAQLLASIVAGHADPDDPLAGALSPEPLTDGAFAAPERWRPLLGRRPHRLRPTPSGRMLEAFGRLPIATWNERSPDRWREGPIRRGPGAPARPFAAFAWERALARYLRTYMKLSIGDVVRRAATVTATPTHLEVVMPLASIDVRIRTNGLDIDPGWVPWLGRVIRFHYRERPR